MELTVLLADADPDTCARLAAALRRAGCETLCADGGLDALRKLAEHRVDVVVLAAAMPLVDGLETTRRLRAAKLRVPVIVVAEGDGVDGRVAALEAGADDCVSRPFALRELLARIQAAGRRFTGDLAPEPLVRAYAGVRLDHHAHLAWRGDRELQLTRTEFLLLDSFLQRPEQVLERSELLLRVWGYDFGPASNTLGVYVGYVRRKLELHGEPRLIHTVRSVGYVMREPGINGRSVSSQPTLSAL